MTRRPWYVRWPRCVALPPTASAPPRTEAPETRYPWDGAVKENAATTESIEVHPSAWQQPSPSADTGGAAETKLAKLRGKAELVIAQNPTATVAVNANLLLLLMAERDRYANAMLEYADYYDATHDKLVVADEEIASLRARLEARISDDDVRRAICAFNRWEYAEMAGVLTDIHVQHDDIACSLRRVLTNYRAAHEDGTRRGGRGLSGQ